MLLPQPHPHPQPEAEAFAPQPQPEAEAFAPQPQLLHLFQLFQLLHPHILKSPFLLFVLYHMWTVRQV